MTGRRIPPARDEIRLMDGYHSPQVDVKVRLNANESPLPPPAAWQEELAAEIGAIDFNRYPDRSASALRAAIAAHHGVPAEQVFAANGSNEVLQTLLLAYGGPGRTVAVFEPTYALHSHIARVCGTHVEEGQRSADLSLNMDEVRTTLTMSDPTITFLCSPNNPTGMLESPEVVTEVLSLVPGLLVVDEAYGQFAPWSAASLVAADVPLVVTRTYSKTWSMAAMRLGYLIGPREVVTECEKVVLPYHLDAVTQAAGVLALRHEDEMRARVEALVAERERVASALGGLRVDTWPSAANFILFRPRDVDADDVWQGLLDRQVLVRSCTAWPGLSGCLRVTIGTPAEDDAFLAALAEALEGAR